MSVSYYTEIENGTNQINAKWIERLAKFHGITEPELFEVAVDPNNPSVAAMVRNLNQLSDEGRKIVNELMLALIQK